ncbi:hypothetical protein [Kordiimonas sp. SCSIO 12610]|uniref:hypothetical protein n=1 Tax=Kordiimonas sp. SCSIO 12610 TaxID=2829597 RepID=UPI00210B9F6A|nr:hypothetical protein [Kordiimonas sp. SCSIO 12610]UTW56036.1 hypothetical protein KFF44_03840 [Kordiimonas sp. SCSIO 12610]
MGKNVKFDFKAYEGNSHARRVFWYRAGYIVGLTGLVGYWIIAILKLMDSHFFIHANYWGQPIGTFGFMIVLLVCSVAWVWTIPKYWNGPIKADEV